MKFTPILEGLDGSPVHRSALLAAVAALACDGTPPPEQHADTRVSALVAAVSPSRLQQTVATLASFGTRNTLSDTASPDRGIGAAREWIFKELQRASSRLQVSFDIHHLAKQGRITRPVELRNIVAILPAEAAGASTSPRTTTR